MRRVILGLALLLIFTVPSVVLAGDDGATPRNSHFALGYNLNNVRHDFGFGLNVTSPYFLNDRVAVRFSVNTAYFEGVPTGQTENEWMPYSIYKLGLVGVGTVVNDLIRLYGEGGVVYIMPNSRFSEENRFGGYGHFGFEFLMSPDSPLCYFIELGSMGAGARAEKIEGKPVYVSGFATAVGLRFHF